MKSKTCLATCAAILSLPCSFAVAEATASVRTSPLVVTLVDLDELDGITPSISFEPTGALSSYAFVRARDQIRGTEVADYRNFDAWGSAEMAAALPWATASAEVISAGTPAGSTFTASGSARGAGEDGQFFFDAYINPSDPAAVFTLSPNTVVQISLSSTLSTTASFALNSKDGKETADALVSLLVYGTEPNGVDVQWDYDAHYLRSGYVSGLASAAGTETLTVSFSNQTNAARLGNFSLQAWAWGSSQVTVVPEPATYVMSLAGLALLCALRRARHGRGLARSPA
ncbi:PEP-CTERM sorting domain-containing protein [Paucibacter sp. PLA-PC-4]|uniref:PEP-CTERM sorting domain-containing protein n=1 Tax=Paucibacter sp. PLA-PC-4 TaxID=2993655 RepID=UPI00224AD1D6|nr:PEP-CTERM sorting domain-containing protein [Paucibacter sp. PLA-PC-4]MCX2863584.1 PEP-CTERM sorting domain-containing protein [Paucibacter sp. PLA-PC-4]